MTDAPPLPPLQDAVLTADDVAALLDDVARATTLLGHSVKGGARDRAAAADASLGADGERLLAGEVLGLQVRYLHDGEEWWDTLLALPQGGFRLVRIQQRYGAPPAGE